MSPPVRDRYSSCVFRGKTLRKIQSHLQNIQTVNVQLESANEET